MMRSCVAALSLSLALGLGSTPAAGDEQELTLRICKEAEQLKDELLPVLQQNPAMMRDAGLVNPKAADVRMDCEHLFQQYLVDAAALETAASLADAVRPSGIYRVPFCVAAACPLLLSFEYQPASDKLTMESFGRDVHAAKVNEGRARWAAFLASVPERGRYQVAFATMVQGGQHFLYVTDTGGGEAFLLPGTEAQAKALGPPERIDLPRLRELARQAQAQPVPVSPGLEPSTAAGASDPPAVDGSKGDDPPPR